MAKLNGKQEALMAHASNADDKWRQAKLNAKIRLKRLVEEEIAQFAAARDRAVWDALQAGVPKRQVGIEALKTSSPHTVNEIYDRMIANQELVEVELAVKPVEKYEWSAPLVHPISKLKFIFLQVDGDDHWTEDDQGVMTGSGYLFYQPTPGGKWLPRPDDKPNAEVLAWAEANPPV